MTLTRRRRLAGPLFGVLVLVVAGALAFTPVVPSVGAIDPTPAPSDSPAPSTDPTPTVAPDPTPSPPVDPTPAPSDSPAPPVDPTPTPDPSPTPDPTPSPTPSAVRGSISLSADAPGGRRRVSPGSIVTVSLSARVLDDARAVSMVAAVPAGWSVVEGGGDPATFEEGDLEAGASVTETIRLRAPARSPEGRPAFDAVLSAQLRSADELIDAASVRLRVAPEIIAEHVTFARVADATREATYLAPNAPLDGVGRYDVFRIRFQVRNADAVAVSLSPGLQWSAAGSGAFAAVPTGGRKLDVPFFVGPEWRPIPGGRGTLPGPDSEGIAAADVRVHDRDDDAQRPTRGERLMGAQRVPTITLDGDSYTEVEYTVKVTAAVELGREYQFRLVDAGRSIDGAVVAQVLVASVPALTLSPGQRDGIRVGPPVDATPSPVREMDLPLFVPSVTSAAWPESGAGSRYRLAVAIPTTPSTMYPLAAPFTTPHAPDTSLVSDTCAGCHRTHVAQGPVLAAQPPPQSAMCFTCHDGSGSSLDTKAQYTDPAVPANDPVTRSYYRHDAVEEPVAPNTHALATDDEFGGVSNRHSVCTDCHNVHNATGDPSTQTTTGWTVAGQNVTASGVAVTNGAAGTAPAYTFLGGSVASQPTREYELCIKCHSGFTTLNDNAGQPPSREVLDKAVELNPNNASYHPVEAPGKNTSVGMAGSLAGTSPFKQWNFTTGGTVRCVNCHGDPRKYDATTPPAAGSDLAPHSSEFRGLLIQVYRDRVLKGRFEAYAAADFALCYVCHAEAPFLNSTFATTNFLDHDKHVTRLTNEGTNASTDIDTPGAGQGNAICSECHFRTHGTALAYKVGDRSNERLVNFAPNVTDWDGVVSFSPKGLTTDGSCTLTCHGKAHDAEGY